MSSPRYRPVLSPEEITFLLKHLKLGYINSFTATQEKGGTFAVESKEEAMLLRLMNKFAALDARIQHSITAPAYTTLPPAPSLMEQLGEVEPEFPSAITLTPAAKRLAAYGKWQVDISSCTGTEIADAMEYRFQEGLMTKKEADAYNAKMWSNITQTTPPKEQN